ncbi:D-aminoacyl-tRNA deacylase [Clostridium cylindrosporum]|uniref:D-aminoacyl-tRNA deacylase n=1 Tax=Clostridium cylindrosporum DSM 605 TaxID=1121307 RepID=A0A0J8DAD1_CLOCY|nr:D-aminoacyl-tRNA deacylase [Clostridium cylindrosporum]KMT21274.1 D-tyrosyl-tRNA(Tyr) deacylase Dtd [Clostridium cylindrosporum DSM 605]
MRAVVQRVDFSKVEVDKEVIGSINRGLLVLLGVEDSDEDSDIKYMVDKIVNLRIFEDENEKMNLSLKDINGELLVVSQFTLYGDCRRGRRPNFMGAAKPEFANSMYEEFLKEARGHIEKVESGSFGAHMNISLLNNGPVTILLDSKKNF